MNYLQAMQRPIETMSDGEIDSAIKAIGEYKRQLRSNFKVEDYCCDPDTRVAPPESDLVRELRAGTNRISELNRMYDRRHGVFSQFEKKAA